VVGMTSGGATGVGLEFSDCTSARYVSY
jgi:hypothetical protein